MSRLEVANREIAPPCCPAGTLFLIYIVSKAFYRAQLQARARCFGHDSSARDDEGRSGGVSVWVTHFARVRRMASCPDAAGINYCSGCTCAAISGARLTL